MSITSARAKRLHRHISFLLQTPQVEKRFGALQKALGKFPPQESHYDHCAKMILRNQWKLYEYKDYAPLLRAIIGHTSKAMRGKVISHIVHHGTLKDISEVLLQFGKPIPKEALSELEQIMISGSVPDSPRGIMVKTGPPSDTSRSRIILKRLDVS